MLTEHPPTRPLFPLFSSHAIRLPFDKSLPIKLRILSISVQVIINMKRVEAKGNGKQLIKGGARRMEATESIQGLGGMDRGLRHPFTFPSYKVIETSRGKSYQTDWLGLAILCVTNRLSLPPSLTHTGISTLILGVQNFSFSVPYSSGKFDTAATREREKQRNGEMRACASCGSPKRNKTTGCSSFVMFFFLGCGSIGRNQPRPSYSSAHRSLLGSSLYIYIYTEIFFLRPAPAALSNSTPRCGIVVYISI